MELQIFIDNNDNYFELFKKNNLKIKNFKNLIIVKQNYGDNINEYSDQDYWKMYCRGCVINTKTNKLICIPPVKSIEIEKKELDKYLNDKHSDNEEIQELIDGTMINLFYYNNDWIISTRSDIGGYNKWNNKSFKDMFKECQEIEYNDLNKD